MDPIDSCDYGNESRCWCQAALTPEEIEAGLGHPSDVESSVPEEDTAGGSEDVASDIQASVLNAQGEARKQEVFDSLQAAADEVCAEDGTPALSAAIARGIMTAQGIAPSAVVEKDTQGKTVIVPPSARPARFTDYRRGMAVCWRE